MRSEGMATLIDSIAFAKVKEELALKQSVVVNIISGSMEPVIQTGETVIVAPVQFESLERFDPIVFWNGKYLICHYVWHFNHLRSPDRERIVLTRGMGSRGPDFPITESQILGITENVHFPWYLKLRELWNRGKIK